MAIHYANLLNGGTLVSPAVLAATYNGEFRAPAGLGQGRMARIRSEASLPAVILAIGDQIRFARVKSGDRMLAFFLQHEKAGTLGTVKIGLYKAGARSDGVAVDDNRWGNAYAVSAASAGTYPGLDAWTFNGLTEYDRGKTLWEVAGLAADPMEDWEIAATFTVATTVPLVWRFRLNLDFTNDDL